MCLLAALMVATIEGRPPDRWVPSNPFQRHGCGRPGLYVETDDASASQYRQGKFVALPPAPLTPTRGPVRWGKTTPSSETKNFHCPPNRSSPSFARVTPKLWATQPGPRAKLVFRRGTFRGLLSRRLRAMSVPSITSPALMRQPYGWPGCPVTRFSAWCIP